MSIDYEAVRSVFLEQAGGSLDRIERLLGELVPAPGDRAKLWEVFRHLHTLKGDAATVDLKPLAERAHRGEDLVEELHGSGAPLDEAQLQRLFDLASDLRRSLAEARSVHHRSERLSDELQSLAVAVRRVPVGTLFRPFQGTVHHAAAAEGKKARLVILGDDVEIDARLAESLHEPLLHLVRNAVGHGLESPETRQAAGKPPVGTVTLSARSVRDRVEISVEDDGRGVDGAELARRTGSAPGPVSPERLLDWMTRPGLSTRDEVDELSGRGVGMDVVRQVVTRSRGFLELATEPGRGTTIRMLLPASVRSIEALEVLGADGTPVGLPAAPNDSRGRAGLIPSSP